MTFVSLADSCRLLGIDAKTLRRWLAPAHVPLQRHPHDGRKHGLSRQDLERLARLHHRHLAPLSEAQQSPAPLPDALLALPEMLAGLQAQLSALQQQVADLSHRLEHQAQPPAVPTSASHAMAAPHAQPVAPSSAPTTAAATPPPKPRHVIALVDYAGEGHYVLICPKHGLLPVAPDSPAWFAWLETVSSFRFVGKRGRFTAHHEGRVPHGAWRAHRHIRNHSHTLRLAPTPELTVAVLEQAAAALQAHLS